jgi:hypothetical protein
MRESGEFQSAAGPLREISPALGVELVPVDGPGAAGRFGIVAHDVGIGDAEAEVTDGGKRLAGGAGYGEGDFGLGHGGPFNEGMNESRRNALRSPGTVDALEYD